MRAYSRNLRQGILRAVEQGKPRAENSKTFAVSRSTIKRYLKLRRETGDVKPKTIPGRPSKKGTALYIELLPQLEAHPDATLAEHCQFWEATHGIQVSSATMSRAMKRLNWTRKKKTIRASEEKRFSWRDQQIPPCLNCPTNRSWLRACKHDKSSFWTICTRIPVFFWPLIRRVTMRSTKSYGIGVSNVVEGLYAFPSCSMQAKNASGLRRRARPCPGRR